MDPQYAPRPDKSAPAYIKRRHAVEVTWVVVVSGGRFWYGTGPRRCLVSGCKCKGCYIGSTPARCKENASD